MAGTTIDERGAVYVARADAVQAAGLAVTGDAVQRWMGADKREAMAGLVAEAGGQRPSGADVERMYERFRGLLAKAYADDPPVPVAGAVEAFAALRDAGVRIALTTG